MRWLARLVFTLMLMNAVCLVLVIALHYSESAWGCLSFMHTSSVDPSHNVSAQFDLEHGSYFVERPTLPLKYINSVQWIYFASDKVIYEYQSPGGTHRIGAVSQTRSYGYVDGKNDASTSFVLMGISPDQQYIATSAVDSVQAAQTVTIRHVQSFTPIVTLTQDYKIDPSLSLTALTATAWSPANRWFAYISPAREAMLLTLISLPDGYTQTMSLPAEDIYSSIVWSPAENALVVLSGTKQFNVFPKLDLIALIDGRWQTIASYDGTIDDSASLPPLQWLLTAFWSLDGKTLLVTRHQPFSDPTQDSLLRYKFDGQRVEQTIMPLHSVVAFVLGNTWLCATDLNTQKPILTSLTELHPAVNMSGENYCGATQSAASTLLIAKQTTVAHPEGQWVALRTDPYSLTPLTLPSDITSLSWWSLDNRKAIFYRVTTPPLNASYSGQVGIIDTTTWQWSLFKETVSLSNTGAYVTIAPDLSRYTLLSEDQHRVFLLDMQSNIIAELPILPGRDDFYGYFTLRWNPDSTGFILTGKDTAGNFILSRYDRDGHQPATFRKPDHFVGWVGSYSISTIYTHCEPSPKFPRMNLPQ